MWRLVVLTFVVLGWTYYEMSGGSDFQPVSEMSASERQALGLREMPEPIEEVQLASAQTSEATEDVTRSSETPSTVRLASLTPVPQPTETEDEVLSAPVDGSVDAVIEEVVAEIEVPAAEAADIRTVSGSRVNMRSGPGTNHAVLNQLVRGDEAEVLEELGNGWVHLRVISTGETGYMAGRLLSDG